MANYANAVIAKARAMFGQMLSPAQYDELLRKQSVQEISAYLKEKTTYRSALAGVQDSEVHRGQLEMLLHKDVLYQYVRLVNYVRAKDSVYEYIIMDMEIETILSRLRDLISSREEDDYITSLPSFIQPYVSFNIFDMAHVDSVEQMAEFLKGTPYGPVIRACKERLDKQDGRIDYTAYEMALRNYYFSTLLERARKNESGAAYDQLRELITMRAETMNLNTIYRMKTYFGAQPEQIRAVILPFRCKLSRRELDALIEARDEQAFRKGLSGTVYGKHLPEDAKFLENETDNMRYRLDLHMLRFSTDPQVVFMAFMLLRGMETENIVRIIEGVRYQRAPEKIQQLLYRA